jgi:hypothetical protein
MSTLSSLNTVLVLEAFLYIVPSELADGNIVELGDFDTFRVSVSSKLLAWVWFIPFLNHSLLHNWRRYCLVNYINNAPRRMILNDLAKRVDFLDPCTE